MKYRLLVVEDDNNIREGLLKIIGKMELPIESLYKADNGLDALEIAGREKPHIIITDIKMPSMNGLDFIENIKSSGSNAKFIILSGYSEFTFAQRAISCNVSEYLLKPIKKDKLHSILLKLMEEISREEEAAEQKIKIERKIKEYHSVVLKEILEGYQNPEDIYFILSNAGIGFKKSGFAICSFYCKSEVNSFLSFLDRSAGCLDISYKYKTRHNHIICLTNLEMGEHENLFPLLSAKILEYAQEHNTSVYSGLSEWTDSAIKLVELVKEAEKALDFRLFSKTSRVFPYSEIKKLGRLKPVLNVYYAEMSNSMKKRDIHDLCIGIDRLFDYLQRLSPLTPGLFKNAITGYILYCMPSDKQELIMSSIEGIEDIYQASVSLDGFRLHIKQMLCSLCKGEKEDGEYFYSSKINTAIKYIEVNYSKNICLEEVAGHIRANASYFSNTFKKVTGMYFSDYVQKIRIEKSKSLLLQPQYKIYEVAESVGFLDEKYYFKIFKKLTGVTPNQYRNGNRLPQ